MAWPTPQYSKNRVRTAGKRIAKTFHNHNGLLLWNINIDREEFDVVENWRTSHGAVLNTAQAWLRRLDKLQRPIVGQRLKRYNTIVDKLATGRSKDLSTMHDIAGVRAIFRSVKEIHEFRAQMRLSKAQHILIHETDKFDYLTNPKNTGYRGIHEVMERHVDSKSGAAWNGLKFEVQLRTAVQHAWATAVEIFDDTQSARFKFQKSANPAYEQFMIASEIFARVHEQSVGCLADRTDTELANRFTELEEETRTVTMIHGLQVAVNYRPLEKNSILQRTHDGQLFVYPFSSFPQALRAISAIEARPETLNAVLVGAKTPYHIREAFRNYFEDTSDFVALLDDALRKIRGRNTIDLWNAAAPARSK
ncbi:RelA/SpoT domain-containing protein [Pseudorhodobacter ferrugineus]|uniref:RelA/SpoT domain-containing protein n=1 Tax=Pseudorhodobacter ferrugineus TaxID=77008 RepID=UPI0003B6317D|nr:RelA/SpoT domain-containing protein [Pseudorhodobacter ferrugineus]